MRCFQRHKYHISQLKDGSSIFVGMQLPVVACALYTILHIACEIAMFLTHSCHGMWQTRSHWYMSFSPLQYRELRGGLDRKLLNTVLVWRFSIHIVPQTSGEKIYGIHVPRFN